MLEHGAILFIKKILADFDDEIRTDAEQVSIEGRVVQTAQGDPVREDRLPFWMAVGDDVSSLQEFLVAKTADCTLLAISSEDPTSELLLMQPPVSDGCDRETAFCVRRRIVVRTKPDQRMPVISGNAPNRDRPCRDQVYAGVYASVRRCRKLL